MILCIETATDICSVALSHEGNPVALIEDKKGRSHATGLTPLIEKLLLSASATFNDLTAVAVSKGPGSYTGLRIGVSVAKGITYATGIPLIGTGTLESMFHGLLMTLPPEKKDNTFFCPMIDARRMEVYNAIYDGSGNIIKDISADVIDRNSFSNLLSDKRIIFFGDGAAKCRNVITDTNAVFIEDFTLSASFLAKPAYIAFQQKKFEDVAYFEPFYLKDFIATVAKNQLLSSKRKEK